MRRQLRIMAINVAGLAIAGSVAVTAGIHFEHNNGAVRSPFQTAAKPAPPPLSYLGVYEPASPHSYAGVDRFAKLIGRQPNIAVYYSSWWEPFQARFARNARAHNAVPMVQIEPRGVAMAAIAAGRYDSYLRAFARSVRSYGHTVVLSFGHEMNADWYGWGYRHTRPGAFVAAWRHIHELFARRGARNVRWLWTVNVVGGPDVGAIAAWWPGPGYVTWVGVDGHYFTPAIKFASLFGATLGQIRRLTGDSVLIAEAGIAPSVAASRIIDLFSGARAHGLLGVVWFDVPGHNLRIEGDRAAVADFRRAVRQYTRPGPVYRASRSAIIRLLQGGGR